MPRKLMILTVALALAGCAAPMRSTSDYSYKTPAPSGDDLSDLDERLIVSSADLQIKTDRSDSLHNRVMDIAIKYDGYVLSSGNEITTIRLPAVSFEDALDDIEMLGEVVEKNISGNDVTEEYRDLEIRLENAAKTRDRYLALLEKADNIDEILKLERELERFNGIIETIKGKLERLSHLVQYSSITVKTFEKFKPGPVSLAFNSLFKGMKWLFVRN